MSDGSEITLLTIFNEIGKLRHDVFTSIQHDQEQCRARHDEINKMLSSASTQNGVQDKTINDHETRQRTGERFMYIMFGGFTVLNAAIGLLLKIM